VGLATTGLKPTNLGFNPLPLLQRDVQGFGDAGEGGKKDWGTKKGGGGGVASLVKDRAAAMT